MKVAACAMLMLCVPTLTWAQSVALGNMGHFDERPYHFGIQIGYTQSKFDLNYEQYDANLREILQGVTSYYSPGFHVAVIVPDFRLNRWFSLRLVPGVTIVSRHIEYSWEQNYLSSHLTSELGRRVESVYGDIPVELVLRAARWYNFRPFVTAGGSYGFDFASLRKNRNETNQAIVRLEPSDLRYSMGVGFDVFLTYVKFAIELKMNFGLVDLKVDDPDIYIRSFDGLHSRTFMLSFTFEG